MYALALTPLSMDHVLLNNNTSSLPEGKHPDPPTCSSPNQKSAAAAPFISRSGGAGVVPGVVPGAAAAAACAMVASAASGAASSASVSSCMLKSATCSKHQGRLRGPLFKHRCNAAVVQMVEGLRTHHN